MRKAIPILIVLVVLTFAVYFLKIRPARFVDPAVRGSGSVEATVVVVSPKVGARILAITVEEGARVEAGQLLVTLDCAEIETRKAQAEAQVVQAEAAAAQAEAVLAQATAQTSPLGVQRDLARREAERTRVLAKSQATSERALDQAESALKGSEEQMKAADLSVNVARRAVAVAEAQVALAKKSVELAATLVAECTLEAPQAGTVMTRLREPGELVLPGASVLEIGRLDEVYTWIYVANDEVGRVKVGQQVELVADTYPERKFIGTVARVNEQAEFTPRSIQTKADRTRLVYGVKVTVANADRALMPGMPVEALVLGADAPVAAKAE